MAGFQTSINIQPAPAVEGDFASANVRLSVLATQGTLTAGAAGVTVGRFAWADVNGVVLNSGQGMPSGFVHREMQALITVWLGAQSMVIPQGLMVTLLNEGDFWVKNTVNTTSITNPRQKAFASLLDGSVQFGAAGATVSGNAITASFATNVMTVTVTAGTILVGQLVTSAGVAAGTYITGQTSGTAGSTGTYTLSTTPGTITSQAATSTSYIETNFALGGLSSGGVGAVGELVKITTGGKQ